MLTQNILQKYPEQYLTVSLGSPGSVKLTHQMNHDDRVGQHRGVPEPEETEGEGAGGCQQIQLQERIGHDSW